MAATYEPIATTTLGSAQASVTFSSISGYTDIVIVNQVKTTTSNAGTGLRFNSDSGTNYSYTQINGNGTAAASGRETNRTSAFIASNGVSLNTEWSIQTAHVMNYANSTTNKTVIGRANGSYATEAIVSLWRNTSAITSIQVMALSGNFDTGSTFTLYGIKAA